MEDLNIKILKAVVVAFFISLCNLVYATMPCDTIYSLSELPNMRSDYLNGTLNGHQYVDLGTTTKWASVNVDANDPFEYGKYFDGRGYYYISPGYSGDKWDWGQNWEMPTHQDFEELISITTHKIIVYNNKKVLLFMAKNGNYIMLPFAGVIKENDNNIVYEGSEYYGGYWSNTMIDPESGPDTYLLDFNLDMDGPNPDSWSAHWALGLTIRPVFHAKIVGTETIQYSNR